MCLAKYVKELAAASRVLPVAYWGSTGAPYTLSHGVKVALWAAKLQPNLKCACALAQDDEV